MTIFVHVAESGGFTAAANRLGISAAAVSKSISLLERELGVKLVNRTTRSVSLTDEGHLLLERGRAILFEIDHTEALLAHSSHQPRGRVRIHAPVGMGRILLMPALLSLINTHPELSISADFSDRTPNIAEENFDAVLRIGHSSDSRLIARTLTRLRYFTCASPGYLEGNGIPQHPRELLAHNCMGYVQWNTGRHHEWDYQKGPLQYVHTPEGRLNLNHPEAILDAAIKGAGIARMASYIAGPAIIEGKLRVILLDWTPKGQEVQLVYLPNRQLSPRIQVLIAELKKVIPDPLPWESKIVSLSKGRQNH